MLENNDIIEDVPSIPGAPGNPNNERMKDIVQINAQSTYFTLITFLSTKTWFSSITKYIAHRKIYISIFPIYPFMPTGPGSPLTPGKPASPTN